MAWGASWMFEWKCEKSICPGKLFDDLTSGARHRNPNSLLMQDLKQRMVPGGTSVNEGISGCTRTFISTDSLSFSRLTILMATFWHVTQWTPSLTNPARRDNKHIWLGQVPHVLSSKHKEHCTLLRLKHKDQQDSCQVFSPTEVWEKQAVDSSSHKLAFWLQFHGAQAVNVVYFCGCGALWVV